LLPIVEAFKKAGNRVISVIAARSKDLSFWKIISDAGRMRSL